MTNLGVVVIGRNEGERLRCCLESVVGSSRPVIYVDSGSTDGSVALARSLGVEVVELDLATPFTAARARNVGVERLLQVAPSVHFAQFVDGDCSVVDGWLDRGLRELEARPDVAVICGRLRERFPERSIYNRLAELEWDTPIGEIDACGGIAMMRLVAFRAVGGFNPEIIAGEEGELCLRLRRDGNQVVRLDAEMARHDMAMSRFGQWWRRAVRTGHAYAEGAGRHGRSLDRHLVHQLRSILAWGIGLPATMALLALPTRGLSLILLTGYPLLIYRIRRKAIRRGWSLPNATLYATFCTLSKFPQALGAVRYWGCRLRGRRGELIEYKVIHPKKLRQNRLHSPQ
jgi:GT2 family glycosyltransferase